MLRLEIPNTSHEKQYNEMIEEWGNFEKTPTSPSVLFKWENFQEFLDNIQDIRNWIFPNHTASTLLFLIGKDKILGWIDIRHNIIHPKLRDYSGHIGYWIRPSERAKWYATKMLELWLQEAKKLWLSRVMISCLQENIASAKVVKKNWWELEQVKTIDDPSERRPENKGKKLGIYWITL